MNAIDLLKIEILKYRDNTLVRLLLSAFTLLMIFGIFVMKNMKNIPVPGGVDSFFSFPTIWEYQAYGGSWLSFFFLGYLGTYIITSEFSYRTTRQNIITGYTRNQFLAAKFIAALAITVFATIIFFLSTSVIGIIHQDAFSLKEVFHKHEYVVWRFMLLSFAYISFGMLSAYLFRRGGLSMFFYFSYILFAEPLLRWWFHNKVFGQGKSMLYYPMNAIEDLAPMPFYKYLDSFSPIKDFNILLNYREAAIISIPSVALFVILSIVLFKKRDL